MSQSYTREDLRALPNMMRKQFLQQMIQQYVDLILGAAKSGNTSIMLDIASDKAGIHRNMQYQLLRTIGQSPPTMEEIRETLLEKFPDCTIAYEEKWVDTIPGKRELKKGLTVDWS
jgi:hypothetical protein